jgi:hypothetical protein
MARGERRRRPPDMDGTANLQNKLSGTADNGWSSACGLGEGLTTTRPKGLLVSKSYTGPRTWRAIVNTVMDFRVP